MLTLHRLGLGYRVLYTGILVLMTTGTAVHTVHQHARGGVTPSAIQQWYLGNEDDPRATVMLFERSLEEVWDEVALTSLTYTIAFLVFAGVLARSGLNPAGKATTLLAFALLAGAATATPLLVRYVAGGFAWLGSAAYFGLPVLALFMTARTVGEMWLRRRAGPRFRASVHG